MPWLHVGLSVDVELELRTRSQGGRHGLIMSGYRPWCVIPTPNGEQTFGMFEVELAEPIAPGGAGAATLLFEESVAEFVKPLLHDGIEFAIVEGQRVVGTARVLRVNDPSDR